MLLYILVSLASIALFSVYLSMSILSLINKVLFGNFDKAHLCLLCPYNELKYEMHNCKVLISDLLFLLICSVPLTLCSFLYLDYSSTDISVCLPYSLLDPFKPPPEALVIIAINKYLRNSLLFSVIKALFC